MKLSIIVPVYNTERYLPECLDSLLAQQWKDLEIICVNDGSPDNSAAVLSEYERKDPRIQVISQENKGLSGARNSGLRAASGDYVCFVDSDDLLLPDACERLAMECLGKEPDLVIFGAKTIPGNALLEDRWLSTTLAPQNWMCRDEDLSRILSRPSAWPFVWRNCVRRSLLMEKGLMFDEQVRYGEDTLFQLCLLPMCKRISFIGDKLYCYRVGRPDSLMGQLTSSRERRAAFHMPIVEKVGEFWHRQGWMETWGSLYLAWSLEFVAYDVSKSSDPKRYAKDLMGIWNTYSLDVKKCTNRCRVYVHMIRYLGGGSAIPYIFYRILQRSMTAASRVYRKLKGVR